MHDINMMIIGITQFYGDDDVYNDDNEDDADDYHSDDEEDERCNYNLRNKEFLYS